MPTETMPIEAGSMDIHPKGDINELFEPNSIERGFKDPRSRSEQFNVWLQNHRMVAADSWLRLWLMPVSSLLSIILIGFSLALPVFLSVLLAGSGQLSTGWRLGDELQVYLDPMVSTEEAQQWAKSLEANPEIESITVVSKEEGLALFSAESEISDILRGLEKNPIPVLMVIKPKNSDPSALVNYLKQQSQVDVVQADDLWVQRLQALLQAGERLMGLVALSMGSIVILVILMGTRLSILNQAHQVDIARMFGATRHYLRRPFLYSGFWLGLAGGCVALMLVYLSFIWVEAPLAELARAYGTDLSFTHLSFGQVLQLIVLSTFLSWFGAWIATKRYLP
ncbi:MAG: permease-like cell division protein FtsX [Pseudomonadota bacterium]